MLHRSTYCDRRMIGFLIGSSGNMVDNTEIGIDRGVSVFESGTNQIAFYFIRLSAAGSFPVLVDKADRCFKIVSICKTIAQLAVNAL